MCASCEAATESNGQTNGQTNGHTNGSSANDASNGNGHKEFTAVKSRSNPQPSHRSSPYAPVGDFLSNVGRFKIIGSSPRYRSYASVATQLSASTREEAR
jgi:homocitrate synthase